MLVSFGNVMDASVNDAVIALHESLATEPFMGFTESVPAYSSLAVFYDPVLIRLNKPDFTAAGFVQSALEERVALVSAQKNNSLRKHITIPVYYNGEDLPWIAAQKKQTMEEVIRIHCERTYRVYMIGFLPGFPYMGAVDERIAVPRRSSPRTKVKAGSVGIAGLQTGIYPLDSPGGWQLIGQTPRKVFDKNNKTPCLLEAGDEVQFISISKEEFEQQNEYPDS